MSSSSFCKMGELAITLPISDLSPETSTRKNKKEISRTGKIRVGGIKGVMEAAGVLIHGISQKNMVNTLGISTPRNGNTPKIGSQKNIITEGSFYASNRFISKNTKSRFSKMNYKISGEDSPGSENSDGFHLVHIDDLYDPMAKRNSKEGSDAL
jgi:hypothetical protein